MRLSLVLVLFLSGSPFVVAISAQKAAKANPRLQASSDTKFDAKAYLQNAVRISKSQKVVSILVESRVQGRDFVTQFRFVAPDRYHLSETDGGKVDKEAIEISGQRYQRKGIQWVKVRKDPYPLREQLDSLFPIKLSSARKDMLKVKSSTVSLLENETAVESSRRFLYRVNYSDFAPSDSGTVWVNLKTSLLERLETGGHGLFGPVTSTWKYDYSTPVTIEAPGSFIERDWID